MTNEEARSAQGFRILWVPNPDLVKTGILHSVVGCYVYVMLDGENEPRPALADEVHIESDVRLVCSSCGCPVTVLWNGVAHAEAADAIFCAAITASGRRSL